MAKAARFAELELEAARSSSRWGRSVLRHAWLAAFVLAVVFTNAWATRLLEEQPRPDDEVRLELERTPGPQARASRCSDCTQIGDVMRAVVHGRAGVRVYRSGELVAACDDCTALAFVIAGLGQHDVVGVQGAARCTKRGRVEGDRMDDDLAAFAGCGARFARIATTAR